MTRKKFVKQLMARGYQRNAAEALARYARRCGITYEKYMEIETRYDGLHNFLTDTLNRMAGMLRPICEAASRVMDNLRATFANVKLDAPTLRDWVMENAPQIAEHPCDALDAARYAVHNCATLLHPLPENVQVMSQADHDTLHGYACGVDLAAGPDFTAYKPVMRLDSMVINTGPIIPDMTKKTATELADEIEKKLWPQGGGGHD